MSATSSPASLDDVTSRPQQAQQAAPSLARPGASRIADDAHALESARRLADELGREAAHRDRERRLPFAELDLFSGSGLWGITVPRAYGGAGVSLATLGEVVRIVAQADPSIGQLPKNHFHALDVIRLTGNEAQRRKFFALALDGARIGHAASERGTKTALEISTRLSRQGDRLVLNGQKFYATGALYADWIAVLALDDDGRYVQVLVERERPGIVITDDWSGFGQRTTASGTVTFTDVEIEPENVVSIQAAFETPTLAGPVSQLLHASIDVGIARAALADTVDFVRTRSRPWGDSGVARASDDPYVIRDVAELQVRLVAAEAVLDRVAAQLDALPATVDDAQVARASVDVAVAKVLSTELAILATNKLFELAGTRSVLAEYNLDRHWRNARTHTLHDPVRWKYHAIGNFVLNEVNPPRHGYL
ncbi:SfnB family sulfur acquisition oxidoreductase [Paraburkholderia tropica]|uniref:SfnB family sulfur acquisition oxidoreductase n=1 Tax=Paraburkholderia tropica TaxID=92647 RepID=UPI001CAC9F23|nr:SfnB family sulfur acquisition oxidoreductase [Paraburkholderia tropica]CAG9202548.1 SfnB family sulfur acquisition oxidoreductase [Paraburkholderia tropica]